MISLVSHVNIYCLNLHIIIKILNTIHFKYYKPNLFVNDNAKAMLEAFCTHVTSMPYWQIGIASVYQCKGPRFKSSRLRKKL